MKGEEREQDIQTIQIWTKKENAVEIGMSSVVGTRQKQEDTIFGHSEGNRAIAIVCDGMGGLNGGEAASRSAAESLSEAWFRQEAIADIPGFLRQEALRADEKVFLQEREDGERLNAGTTIAAVVIQDGELYWLSVGDSRIYLIRGDEMMAANRDHNYRMTLDGRLERGEITQEEYDREAYRAEALISYLGMGNVTLMDINQQAFFLEEGDIILVSSDGLYRSLSEEMIRGILEETKDDMQAAAEALTAAAVKGKKSGQDNTSVVIACYRQGTKEVRDE